MAANGIEGIKIRCEDTALKTSARVSKSGQTKPGQKVVFNGTTSSFGTLTQVPADLNKITAKVPPNSRVIVTLSMPGNSPSKTITFENADPIKERTGRIYINQTTGEISLVDDAKLEFKNTGPAQNSFNTKRNLRALKADETSAFQPLFKNTIAPTTSSDPIDRTIALRDKTGALAHTLGMHAQKHFQSLDKMPSLLEPSIDGLRFLIDTLEADGHTELLKNCKSARRQHVELNEALNQTSKPLTELNREARALYFKILDLNTEALQLELFALDDTQLNALEAELNALDMKTDAAIKKQQKSTHKITDLIKTLKPLHDQINRTISTRDTINHSSNDLFKEIQEARLKMDNQHNNTYSPINRLMDLSFSATETKEYQLARSATKAILELQQAQDDLGRHSSALDMLELKAEKQLLGIRSPADQDFKSLKETIDSHIKIGLGKANNLEQLVKTTIQRLQQQSHEKSIPFPPA